MYKYIFNLLLFSFLLYLDELLGGGSYYQAIAPALVLNIAQAGLSYQQQQDAKAEKDILDDKLNIAAKKLNNIKFINQLEALTVPKNIRGQQAAERAERVAVETMQEAGQRGVANVSKAVQASTDANLALTEEDKKAQYLANLEVKRAANQMEVHNKQMERENTLMEIKGLQQAEKEQRLKENAANNALASAAGGLLTQGTKALNSGMAQNALNKKIAGIQADLKAGNIDQAQADALIAQLQGGVALAKQSNPFLTNPNLGPVPGLGGGGAGPSGGAGPGGPGGGPPPLVSANAPVFDPSAYGIDVNKTYDENNIGGLSGYLASNEYIQGANQLPGLDNYYSAYEAWHKQTYPNQPVEYAGQGAGKLKEFEAALGY